MNRKFKLAENDSEYLIDEADEFSTNFEQFLNTVACCLKDRITDLIE